MNQSRRTVVLVHSGGMGAYVTYGSFVARHARDFSAIIRLPVVPAKARDGRIRIGFLQRVAASSLAYILFNLLVSPLYDLLARLTGANLRSLAAFHGIPYRRFEQLGDRCLNFVRALNPDLIINASSFLLDHRILEIPRIGVLNFHGAPLPQYRGAGNYVWVLANGEANTHGTLHFVEIGLDTGDIVAITDKVPIGPEQTVFDLWIRVRRAAKEPLESLYGRLVEFGTIEATPQASEGATTRSFPHRGDVAMARRKGHRFFNLRDISTYASVLFSRVSAHCWDHEA